MKQKRLGLILANVLPVLILIGEIALIVNHQTGWAIAISIVIAIASFVFFCFAPYGEEVILVAANAGYALTILASWLVSFIEPSATVFIGLLFGFATILVQGILTTNRIQGRL